MSILQNILGPKSKYDQSLPYTYEARIPVFAGEKEYHSCFSDTICGLVDYLHQHNIAPDEVEIVEVYRTHEATLAAQLFTTAEHQWRFKPEICRAFASHYAGHIQEDGCSFSDRRCEGCGLWQQSHS